MSPSESGVSSTRLSPYLAHSPSVAPKTPPFLPTSSPRIITRSSRSISSSIAPRMASRMFSSAISVALRVDEALGGGGIGVGSRLGAPRGLVDLLLGLALQALVGGVVQD